MFYGWWDWRFLFLIFFSTIVDYLVGLFMDRSEDRHHKNTLVFVSLLVNLGVLGYFKYFNFFAFSLVTMCEAVGVHLSFHTLNIILPVGISFYTFQKLSYTLDIYRGTLRAERNFIRFATFVAFFPQLVAGPIVRASHFLPQLREDRPLNWDEFMKGMAQVIWGFFKKVAVADSLSPFVSAVFNQPSQESSVTLIFAVFFFSIQIYCDFSGYSDIAIGLARILGFHFPRNFNFPYFSQNFSQFWERWHISLSSWFRDYVYIPLGGNRLGIFKTFRNLVITMLLGGLWHGASWTFIIWGLLHGLYLVVQRLVSPYYGKFIRLVGIPDIVNKLFLMCVVFILTGFAWIFFRMETLADAANVFKGIAKMDLDLSTIPHTFVFTKGLMMIGFLMAIEFILVNTSWAGKAIEHPVYRIALFSMGILTITLFGTFDAPFIYFQF